MVKIVQRKQYPKKIKKHNIYCKFIKFYNRHNYHKYFRCLIPNIKSNFLRSSNTIILYSNFKYGYGDIMYLIKIAHFLKEKFSYKIIITFKDNLYKKFLSVSTELTRKLYKQIDEVKASYKYAIVIHVATPKTKKFMPYSRDIYLDEYNGNRSYDNYNKYNELGICLTSGLGLNADIICQGIMTLSCENLYLKNTSFIQDCKQQKILSKMSDYYFAYCSSCIEFYYKFIENIINYESVNKTDISIFTVYNNITQAENTLYNVILHNFQIPNINRQNIYSSNNFLLTKYLLPNGKKLFAYFVNFLHPAEFTIRMKNSKQYVLITGDQSFSEAIKFNKLIYYECQTWKMRLFEQYILIIKHILGKKSLLYNFVYEQYKSLVADYKTITNLSVPIISTNYILSKADKLNEEICQVNKYINKNFNIITILAETIVNVSKKYNKLTKKTPIN